MPRFPFAEGALTSDAVSKHSGDEPENIGFVCNAFTGRINHDLSILNHRTGPVQHILYTENNAQYGIV